MLPDILLLVIFIPISKWCFSLYTLPLLSNQWFKELQQLFKAYYLRRTLAQAIAATEEDTEKTMIQFWKDYSICDCITKLAWAWGDVTKECMKNTLKRFGHDC